jgi:hypothetical protein
VVAESGNSGTQIQGVGHELAELRSWPLQFGSFLTAQDVTRASNVAELGAVRSSGISLTTAPIPGT